MILLVLALCAATFGVVLSPMLDGRAHAEPLNLTQYVDPFIGTDDSTSPDPVPDGAGGSTYPGAVYPYGMVQFSPDTPDAKPSGYRKSDPNIDQFSMTHFDGAGCANNENLGIMPTTASVDSTNSPGENWSRFASEKSNEIAHPGYYRTILGDATKVELSATQRTGAARLTFPSSAGAARVLLNTSGNATGGTGFARTTVSGDEVSGWTTGGDFCTPAGEKANAFRIFFVMKFDRPPTGFGAWEGGKVSQATSGRLTSEGADSGGFLTFDAGSGRPVTLKTGLSFVSIDGARQNLAQEQPDQSTFDTVEQAALLAWNTKLNSVQATGGSATDLRKFYTALYHVMQSPNTASDLGYKDADGKDVGARYMGFDGKVHTVPSGMSAVYQNYSGWDVYRSWAALTSLIAPDVMTDIVKSMILGGQQGGLLPRWSQQNTETYTMPGDPGPIVISSAYAFGVRDFDTAEALKLMKENAGGASYAEPRPDTENWPDSYSWFPGRKIRDDSVAYETHGFIPRQPSTSLEYAASDFAIGQFAKALKDGDSSALLQRAQKWTNVFNPASGYVQPRYKEGDWVWPLDPAGHHGFTEGNASQYTWMVPFDYRSLFDLMGGRATAIQRLDQHFTKLNAGISNPYFYIGNEPEHHVPWAYNFAAKPAGTSAVVRRIMNEFTTGAGGLPGNDDLGATSAWYVWAALGMYPATPGADTLALHGPLFSSVLVQRPGDRDIQINGAGDGQYVQRLSVKGDQTSRNFIRYQDIADGGTLDFTMGASPSAWGTGPDDVPPSFNDGFTAENPQPPAAADLGPNLAREGTASGSAPCGKDQSPDKATDGDLTTKWCSTESASYLQVDLGTPQTVSSFVVKHAGLGAENTELNTKAFTIQTSTDGADFTPAATVSGSRDSRTHHTLSSPVTARYVKLAITQPTDKTNNNTSSIYELEVYGPITPHQPAPGTPEPPDDSPSAPETAPAPSRPSEPAEFMLVNQASGRCLDSAAGQWTSNPGSAVAQLCYTAQRPYNQVWSVTSRKELTSAGKCLGASGNVGRGTPVTMMECGASNQQWTFDPDGTIRGVQSRLCLGLDTRAADKNPIAGLVLQACASPTEPGQKWNRS
ncbi:GH92 family glycosyl hydrolase [Streptomyces sp. NPDC051907]|uniref:GH92 family glycosyl hydrolase n=1 Tax=Streptomyces sp. NPDC051907 TaxID=3155284 RepID=UPI003445CEB8